MTAREINAFDEMFNMIFNAVSDQKGLASSPLPEVGIGSAPTGTGSHMNDFFSKLRGHSKGLRWSEQADEDLDRKKVEMELCDTDQQLLEWAMREVFGESKRYEEVAREAIKQVAAGKELERMPQLQPTIYPHLVAHLIRTFRDKYRDPHLALSMFDHARHLSIASYVFGCTTPAYNELIQTRWRCFRDLKGVHDALEEMTINGVDANNHTRKLVEEVRRQVGERNSWEEETELGSGEVWMMLNKIDHLMGKHGKESQWTIHGQRRQNPSDEAWKKAALNPEESGDGWEFGKWGYRGEEPRRSSNERPHAPPPREHEHRNRYREEPRRSWNERWHDPPSRERRQSHR
jgi:hypothetical protein